MQIAILANQDSWYSRDLLRAVSGRGHVATVVDFRSLTADAAGNITAQDHAGRPVDLDQSEGILVRTMPAGSLEQVVFRMDVLARLTARGIVVVNSPRAIECAVDKYLTTARLAEAGIPVPETVTCEAVESAMVAFAKLGGDVVVKPLFGSEGRGIVRLTDAETAFRTFKALRMIQAILYVQRYVQHAGYDVRVMVLDGDVCGTMKRVSDLDFRTNVTQQARAVAYAATDEERQLAVAAANATGTRMAGVDIIRDATGQAMVLEVNAVPGWRALSAITGTDYADLLIQSVEKGP